MRSPIATLQELTIPAGAGQGTPRTIIGPKIPTFLASYYDPAKLISLQVYESSADSYIYQGQLQVGTSPPAFVIGVVGLSSGSPYACEMYRITPLADFLGGAASMDIGLKASSGGLRSKLFVDSGSLLEVDGTLMIGPTGTLTTADGATLQSDYIRRTIQPTGPLSKTDTTLEDVPGMSFQVTDGSMWAVELYASILGPAAANARFAWAGPNGGHSMNRHVLGMAAGSTNDQSASVLMPRRDMGTQQIAGTGTESGTGNGSYRETALLNAGSNDTIQLQFAQGTANASSTTINTPTFMLVQRVG